MKKNCIAIIALLLLSAVSIKAQDIKNTQDPETTKVKVVEPKVFVVLDVTVHDSTMYEQYRIAVEPIIKKYGGKYLVRSGAKSFDNDPDTKLIAGEGKWTPDRLIITQWDTFEQFQKFVKSEDYIKVSKLRKNSSTSKSVIVKEYLKN